VKVQRPIEGRQVKLLCAQAKGEASWAYHAYIGEFDEAVVPLQRLAATRGWQEGTLAVMTSDGEPSIQEVGRGAFDPDFQFVLEYATERLHQGEARRLVDEIRAIANQLPQGDNRAKAENVAIYFENRSRATHYDAFKERGWPIASGNVEGGHRAFIHPVTKRGAGWLVDHLNGLVALACVRQNDWWDEFWTFVRIRRRKTVETANPVKIAA
jgi:hypothetical protein